MESVILSTVAARIAVNLIDRFVPARRPEKLPASQNGKGTSSLKRKTTEEKSESAPSDSRTDSRLETEDIDSLDENTIKGLEAKVKALRAQASQLTSADTFVQYARVTREANRLEKKLKEMRGNDNTLDGMVDIDEIANAMSTALMGKSGQPSPFSLSTKMIAKLAVRLLMLASLWWRFSYGRDRSDTMRGQVMSVDCDLLRPFSWLLRRHTASCDLDDWTCAAESLPTCSVSLYVASFLCNAALSFFVDVFLKLVW